MNLCIAINASAFLKPSAEKLMTAGIDNPWRESRLLLAHVVGQSYEAIFSDPQLTLTDEQVQHFSNVCERRVKREPLSKIIGQREFWGLEFKITKDTLDPRPDSETLIEAVISNFPNRAQPLKILDLGTGSGCLLLSLLSEYPNSWGVGVDTSEAAIYVARYNAKVLGFEDQCAFALSDWTQTLLDKFDVIVSNPPYIGKTESIGVETFAYDPHQALFGGEDGFDCYRQIIPQLPHSLDSKGMAFLEVGKGQAAKVCEMASSQKLNIINVYKDLAQIERVVGVNLSSCS